jgi:hypothetical protein
MTREEAIQALELIQRREQLQREYKARYATTMELPADMVSQEQLRDYLAADLGLPMGTKFTKDQLDMILRSELTGDDLTEWDRLALKEEEERVCMEYRNLTMSADQASKALPPKPATYDQWQAEQREYWSTPQALRKPRDRSEWLALRSGS